MSRFPPQSAGLALLQQPQDATPEDLGQDFREPSPAADHLRPPPSGRAPDPAAERIARRLLQQDDDAAIRIAQRLLTQQDQEDQARAQQAAGAAPMGASLDAMAGQAPGQIPPMDPQSQAAIQASMAAGAPPQGGPQMGAAPQPTFGESAGREFQRQIATAVPTLTGPGAQWQQRAVEAPPGEGWGGALGGLAGAAASYAPAMLGGPAIAGVIGARALGNAERRHEGGEGAAPNLLKAAVEVGLNLFPIHAAGEVAGPLAQAITSGSKAAVVQLLKAAGAMGAAGGGVAEAGLAADNLIDVASGAITPGQAWDNIRSGAAGAAVSGAALPLALGAAAGAVPGVRGRVAAREAAREGPGFREALRGVSGAPSEPGPGRGRSELPVGPSIQPTERMEPPQAIANETSEPAAPITPEPTPDAGPDRARTPTEPEQPPEIGTVPHGTEPAPPAGSEPEPPAPQEPSRAVGEPQAEAVRAGADEAATQAPESGQPEHRFSSTHFEVPDDIAARVRDLGQRIPDADLAADGREATPHITVKYGLHTGDAAKVEEVLKGQGPITVRLGKTSLFPPSESSEGAEVLKVDITGAGLHALNKKLSGALEHTDTHPDYTPHLTVAYLKPGQGAKYAGDNAVSGRTFKLDRLTFSDKEGHETTFRLTGVGASEPLPAPKAVATTKGPRERYTTQGVPHPLSGYLGNKSTMIDRGAYNGIVPEGLPYQRLVEPFGGSGMLGNTIDAGRGRERILNDADPETANFHRVAKEQPDELIHAVGAIGDQIEALRQRHGSVTPAAAREADQLWKASIEAPSQDPVEQAARTAFRRNGSMSVMGSGQRIVAADTKTGGYRFYASKAHVEELVRQIRAHSSALRNTEVTQQDAREVLRGSGPGDLVLVDPPYARPGTKVAGYAVGQDLESMEGALALVRGEVADAVRRGADVIYTNYDSAPMRKALTEAGLKIRDYGRRSQKGDQREIVGYTESRATERPRPAPKPEAAARGETIAPEPVGPAASQGPEGVPGSTPGARRPIVQEEPTRQPTVVRPTKPAVPIENRKAAPFTKTDIEKRLLSAHENATGTAARAAQHLEESGAAGTGRSTTFYRELPGEVRTWLEGRPEYADTFKVTDNPAKAGGEDAAGDDWGRYFQAIQDSHAGPVADRVEAAKEWARAHGEPNLSFLADLHDNLGERARAKTVTDPASLGTGDRFTINGHEFTVTEHEDGYRMLRDGDAFDPVPLDAIDKVPVDKGSLRKGAEPGGEVPDFAGDVGAAPKQKPRTVNSIFDRIADEAEARIKARKVPRGRGAGATTLFDDILDTGVSIAARFLGKGEKFLKSQLWQLKQVMERDHPDVAEHFDNVIRVAQRLMREGRNKRGEPDEGLFERAVGRLNQERSGGERTVLRTVREATGQSRKVPATVTAPEALVAGLRKSERAANKAFREGRADALREAGTGLDAAAAKLKRAKQAAAIEARGAGEAGANRERDLRAAADGLRGELVKLATDALPESVRGQFMEAARDATDLGKVAVAVNRMRHALADYELRSAVRDAVRTSKRPTAKLAEPYRTEARTASAKIRGINRQLKVEHDYAKGKAAGLTGSAAKKRAAVKERDLASKQDATAQAKELRHVIIEAHHLDKADKKVLVEGKARLREQVVTDGVANIHKRREIPAVPGLDRTRLAGLAGRVHQKLLTPDSVGAITGDPVLHTMLSEDLWDGETRVNGNTQRGIDHLKGNLKQAGYEWGSDRLQRLSEGAARPGQARTMTVTLPDAGKLEGTPAELMALYATLTDSGAGRSIAAGSPINWARKIHGTPIRLSGNDISNFLYHFDADLKGVVERAKAYIEGHVRPALFAAHKALKGYEPEAVPNYWRTRRNREQSPTRGVNQSMRATFSRVLEDLGFLREREGGTLPYVIGDFFRDYHEIVHSGAVVTHMGGRVRNAELVFMEPRMRSAVETRFGEGMNRRIDQIIEQAKMLFSEPISGAEKLAANLNKNMAKALLTANPTTWFKQIGGVAKLAAVIGPRHWPAGLAAMFDPKIRRTMLASPFFRDRYEGSIWRRVTPSLGERLPLLGESRTADVLKRLADPRGIPGATSELTDKITILNWFDSLSSAAAWGAKASEAEALGIPAAQRSAWVATEAEQAIRRTNNTHSPLDMSGLAADLRGRPLGSGLLMFTSDSSKNYNLLVQQAMKGKGKAAQAAAAVAMDNAWGAAVSAAVKLGVPAAALALAGKAAKDDPKRKGFAETFARNFARNSAQTVYFGDVLSDMGGAVYDAMQGRPQSQHTTLGTPVGSAVEGLVKASYKAARVMGESGEGPKAGPNRGEDQRTAHLRSSLWQMALEGSKLAGLPIEPAVRSVTSARAALDEADRPGRRW